MFRWLYSQSILFLYWLCINQPPARTSMKSPLFSWEGGGGNSLYFFFIIAKLSPSPSPSSIGAELALFSADPTTHQGGMKYFTSWEPILSAKNFARNSGSQTRQKTSKIAVIWVFLPVTKFF